MRGAPPPPPAPPGLDLRQVVELRRVVVCAGPGGVGKTTTAAAVAVWAARSGLRVAALTIDPARRLADSLGIPDPGAEPREVEPQLWAGGAATPGHLTMLMLDAKRAFDDLVARHAPSPDVRDRILRNPIYRQVSSHLAGAHEYMAMEKLLELESSDRFDLIVLDTPPTRDALDFLAAPERMVDALDSSFLQRFADVMRPTGGLGSRLLVRGVSRALGVMSRITGRELLDQVAAFLTDMGSLLGGFRQRAGAVAKAFRSPRFGFLIVCTPEPESSVEALQLLDRLQAEGMALDALIINRQRSHPLVVSEGERLDALRRRLPAWPLARLDHLARGVALAEADAARAARVDADRAAGIRRRLIAAPRATALSSVPELPANLDSIDALLRIGRALVPGSGSPLQE